jgi:hypothetical protein
MRTWNAILVIAIIAAGFGAGYVSRQHHHVRPSKPAQTQQPSFSASAHAPSGFDPSLILPPPSEKGVMIDAQFDLIRGHFRERAGLEPPPLDSVNVAEPLPLPPEFDTAPVVVLPGEHRAPVIRLPAPDEEPTTHPVVRRVIHRQIGMWMYTNNRDVRLNFDVTRSGPSGIKAVELWARRHAEMPYECVDRMEGDKSPFATRLWSEGNYEFRLVFVSGTGIKSRPPLLEDPPDLYVCLDTTPPMVELLSLQPDPEQAGAVVIRWEASDPNLDENPVALSYSLDGETWQLLADSLPALGEYRWQFPKDMPSEVHLRATAKDKAGNLGVWCSKKKVSVDLTAPEGRISGFVEGLPEPREEVRGKPKFPLKPRTNGLDQEVRVVALLSCAPAVTPEYAGFDRLVSVEFAKCLEDRCAENKQIVKVVKPAEMEAYKKENPEWRGVHPTEIGRKFQADYVIDVEILDVALFEPGTRREQMRGNATIAQTVYDLSQNGREPAFSPPDFDVVFPLKQVVSRNDLPVSLFRSQFVKHLAEQLVIPFTGRSQIERLPEKIVIPTAYGIIVSESEPSAGVREAGKKDELLPMPRTRITIRIEAEEREGQSQEQERELLPMPTEAPLASSGAYGSEFIVNMRAHSPRVFPWKNEKSRHLHEVLGLLNSQYQFLLDDPDTKLLGTTPFLGGNYDVGSRAIAVRGLLGVFRESKVKERTLPYVSEHYEDFLYKLVPYVEPIYPQFWNPLGPSYDSRSLTIQY